MDSELLQTVYKELSLIPECDYKDKMNECQRVIQDCHHENALLLQALKESQKQTKTNEIIIRELINQMKITRGEELIEKAFNEEFKIENQSQSQQETCNSKVVDQSSKAPVAS